MDSSWVARVVELSTQTLPAEGFTLVELAASEEFWDDHDGDRATAATTEFHHDFTALVASLTDRWGQPSTVDLAPFMVRGDPPPLVRALVDVTISATVWRFPDRSVCVSVGQLDREYPIVLVAGAGEL